MRETVNWQKAPLLILVVYDDEDMRRLIPCALEGTGDAVEEAEDEVRTLSAYERWQLKIALLEVLMSGMDGSRSKRENC